MVLEKEWAWVKNYCESVGAMLPSFSSADDLQRISAYQVYKFGDTEEIWSELHNSNRVECQDADCVTVHALHFAPGRPLPFFGEMQYDMKEDEGKECGMLEVDKDQPDQSKITSEDCTKKLKTVCMVDC